MHLDKRNIRYVLVEKKAKKNYIVHDYEVLTIIFKGTKTTRK